MSGRPRKNVNPNPVPRTGSNLPDFDEVMESYKPSLDKICRDMKANWYKQIHIPEIDKEIRATVLLFISIFWDRYRKGEIDQFPPYEGYLYTCANGYLHKQFALRLLLLLI